MSAGNWGSILTPRSAIGSVALLLARWVQRLWLWGVMPVRPRHVRVHFLGIQNYRAQLLDFVLFVFFVLLSLLPTLHKIKSHEHGNAKDRNRQHPEQKAIDKRDSKLTIPDGQYF